jgi:hypothetical protein
MSVNLNVRISAEESDKMLSFAVSRNGETLSRLSIRVDPGENRGQMAVRENRDAFVALFLSALDAAIVDVRKEKKKEEETEP